MALVKYSVVSYEDKILVDAKLGSSRAKYLKPAKKILKKISGGELRRPEGMATLLAGSYAYNYIHGCDEEEDNKDNELQSLIFLCVTEALPYNVTPSEARETSFLLLKKIRNRFLSLFENNLKMLYDYSLAKKQERNEESKFSVMNQELSSFALDMRDYIITCTDEESKQSFLEDEFDMDMELGNINGSSNEPFTPLHAGHPSNLNEHINDTQSIMSFGGVGNAELKDNSTELVDDPFRDLFGNISTPFTSAGIAGVAGGTSTFIDLQPRGDSKQQIDILTGGIEEQLPLLNQKGGTTQSSNRVRYPQALYRQRYIILGVIAFLFYLISAMFCGWTWKSCG